MSRLQSGQVIGALVLIALGVVLLLGNLGLLVLNWNWVWPVVLILFGGWLIWRAFQPHEFEDTVAAWGIGDYRPDLAGKPLNQGEFSHGMGDMNLDLTRAVIPDGENRLKVSHGLGDVTIIVPRDLPARVDASAGMGNVFVLGEKQDGFGPHVSFQSDDYAAATRKVDIHASVGLGKITVTRAG